MKALDLGLENGIWVNRNPIMIQDKVGEEHLVFIFDTFDRFTDNGIICKIRKLFQFFRFGYPAVPNIFTNQVS